MKSALTTKIRNKSATISVIGLGHVGLPTACVFADAGFAVVGADIDVRRLDVLSRGDCDINEPGLPSLVRRVVYAGNLTVTANALEACKIADISIVAVQTPLTREKKPDLSILENTCLSIGKGLSKGKMVIIESTIPPGTTTNVIKPLFEEVSGLKCGRDFWLAYCPERMMPGKALQEIVENSRIIGGYNERSSALAAELYKIVVKGELLICNCKVAEVVKCTENTYRDVNIAFANELAVMCEALEVDVNEVIMLANKHPRVKIHRPGCGVGGNCLTKDPFLLLYPAKQKGFTSKLIENAREINDEMPKHTTRLIVKGLKKIRKSVKIARIAVLGASYKGDFADVRNTPSKEVVKRLLAFGAKVTIFDPYSREGFGADVAEDLYEAVTNTDCLVILTDHSAFKKINLQKVKCLMNSQPLIVDGRLLINPVEVRALGFQYLGIGRPSKY